jgi:hypothetical protein
LYPSTEILAMIKKILFVGLFAGFSLNTTHSAAASDAGGPNTAAATNYAATETHDAAAYKATQARATFNPDHPDASNAAIFYGGQNIQNAADNDFATLYLEGACSLETLYGLYSALKSFRNQNGSFSPDDLDQPLTHQNFHFLDHIFQDL